MPTVKRLKPDLVKYLKKRNLEKKFNKQVNLLTTDMDHPSLNTELLEPRSYKFYSFRIDKKYRAIFILVGGEIEVVDINLNYK